jgi:hypothetical protein
MSTRLDEARAALEHHRTQRDAPPDLFSHEVERVADNAGPEWRAQALEAVRHAAEAQDFIIITDVWRRMPDMPIYDGRAIGQIMRRAKQLGWITPTGQYKPSPVPEHHGRPLLIWRSELQRPGAA